MWKNASQFRIEDVPSLDASASPVYVDIGYLADDDHMNAFIEIFEKFIQDNRVVLRAFETVSIESKKPVGALATGLSTVGGVDRLLSSSREIGKELYCSYNESIKLVLSGKSGSKSLIVTFDNPSFSFG